MAQDYGLVLLENGNLIDLNAGQTVPSHILPMPRTTPEQVDALQVFDRDALAACCVQGDTEGLLIGQGGKLDWAHSFTVERVHLSHAAKEQSETRSTPDVLFLHKGLLHVTVDGETVSMKPGDTLTIPKGANRSLSTPGHADFLRVLGQ